MGVWAGVHWAVSMWAGVPWAMPVWVGVHRAVPVWAGMHWAMSVWAGVPQAMSVWVGCSCFPLGPLCPLLTLSLFSHFVLDLFETGMRTLKLSWQKCTQAHLVSVEGMAWETHLDSCGCSCPYCLNSLQ